MWYRCQLFTINVSLQDWSGTLRRVNQTREAAALAEERNSQSFELLSWFLVIICLTGPNRPEHEHPTDAVVARDSKNKWVRYGTVQIKGRDWLLIYSKFRMEKSLRRKIKESFRITQCYIQELTACKIYGLASFWCKNQH